jgi:hypothetical protein
MSEKQFIINLQHDIDHFEFENILSEIVKNFQSRTIKFAGYLDGHKIVSIDDVNYRIYPGPDRIKLTLTTDKRVKVPSSAKQKAFGRYNEFLRSVQG